MTGKLIAAHTNPGALYPGYINFTREADGTVSVYVRGNPTTHDGVYICGYARDKGQPGRCTPGDDHCNNYCNMAPQKGPMQRSPLACSQTRCGETVLLTLSAADFAELCAAVAAASIYEALGLPLASGGPVPPPTDPLPPCGDAVAD